MGDTTGQDDLATKLNRLFNAFDDPEGKPWTNESIAAALRDRGLSVTGQNIWLLRNGQRSNPAFRLLDGIAGLFDIPISYFSCQTTDDVAELAASLDARIARREGASS